ncbi:hypothetical protein M378DRAFT_79233, partial [Amanita muscaria Koide BX008]
EWSRSALVDAAKQLGDTSLPLEAPDMLDNKFLKTLHHVLLEVKGAMTCPNCSHRYPISNGIETLKTPMLQFELNRYCN